MARVAVAALVEARRQASGEMAGPEVIPSPGRADTAAMGADRQRELVAVVARAARPITTTEGLEETEGLEKCLALEAMVGLQTTAEVAPVALVETPTVAPKGDPAELEEHQMTE